MKRSILLAICLWLCIGAAGADQLLDEDSASREASTLLSLTVPDESYAVMIPSLLPISYGSVETPLPLSVTECFLHEGHVLIISVKDAQGTLEHASDNQVLPYELQMDGRQYESAVFSGVGQRNAQVVIREEDWKKAASGTYTGCVTFDIAIANAD